MPFLDNLRSGIIETANSLGMNPEDLATIMSYETGGTFNPMKRGPTTQYGQHEGLIQFGQPQRAEYGVDLSSNDAARSSQLGADGAVAKYFRAHGWQPGMSGLDAYSVVNAGRPGRYNASDANNGGAPGSVSDKWSNQMAGHRAKAQSLLGGGEPSDIPSQGFTREAPQDTSRFQASSDTPANVQTVNTQNVTPRAPTPSPEGFLSRLGSMLVSQANAGELPQEPALNAVAEQASSHQVNTSDPLGEQQMPSLIDRLLQGDIGGFRDNVQGFEQGVGQPTQGVPADMGTAPQVSPTGDASSAPAGLTPAQAALLRNYPSPQQRAETMQQSQQQPGQGDPRTWTMSDIMPQSFNLMSPPVDMTPQQPPTQPLPAAPNQRSGVMSDEFTQNPAPAMPPLDAPRTVGPAPAIAGVQQPAPMQGPNQPAPMQGPNFPQLPQTGPVPATKPNAKKAFDTMGFLSALGSVAAAFAGPGSPEIHPASLSGVSHRPDGFSGLPMPKGLL
ncbi:hypothetical protein [Rhizobium favelukesii]|uniref:Transglycosylase SLT domain-containing protein n=1 Tax=Rhizobium favelukesii TaxID=348824 RepID=W6R8X0_9HYPH|nr:hypothetical protein [Rhizobium favelukesii]MCS0459332.1 hypothetical protein [Rhizobium favelukesii]CDM57369.1 putative predicted protein [Rhizobium favelukesii]